MGHVGLGPILLVVVLDLGVVLMGSAILGAVAAGAVGRGRRVGVLIGLGLPLLGPMALLVSRWPRRRVEAHTRLPGALALAAGLALLVATPLPWGHVSGAVQQYSWATAASPADSVIGAVATIGSALVLAALAAWSWLARAVHLPGILAGLVGIGWLVIGLDALVAFAAVDGLTTQASGLSGGQVQVVASAGPAVWAVVVAGGCAVLTSAVAAVTGTKPDPAPRVVAPAVVTTAPATASSASELDGGSGLTW